MIDRIKYDGSEDGSPWLVYKYPSEDFVLGSQLVVNSSQEALFFKGGEALDLFGAGTHTLKTGNLPLLNRLTNLPFGGRTPFTAEIYYINKTACLGMGWGTSVPFDMEDPRYKVPLQIGAHGEYDVFIPDTRLFILRLIGAIPHGMWTDPSFVGRQFNGYINSVLKSMIARFMEQRQLSFLNITGYMDELTAEARKAVSDEFERYGVEILNFKIETIKPKDTPELQEAKKLETQRNQREKDLEMERKQFEQGRDFYAQRRSFDVMEKTAENPSAGGLAGAGMGMGMGLGAAGHMAQAFAGMSSNMNTQNSPQQPPQPVGQTCTKCNTIVPDGMKFCGGCGEKMQMGIICPHCEKDVPPGMKFCGECGKPVGNPKCSGCGTDNPPGMKFCGGCGNKL